MARTKKLVNDSDDEEVTFLDQTSDAEQEASGTAPKPSGSGGEAEGNAARVKIERVDRVWNKTKRKYFYVKTSKPTETKRFHRNVVTVARKLTHGGEFMGQYHIEIRSNLIPQILNEIYAGIESLDFAGPVMEFDGNELDFLFLAREGFMTRLVAELSSEKPDPELVFELEAITEFIAEHYEAITSAISKLPENTIDADHLWTLFPPGCLVYAVGELGEERVYHLQALPERVQVDDGGRCWSLDLRYLDFDGMHLGYRIKTALIPAYKGIKSIFSLPFLPLSLRPDRLDIQERLIRRSPQILRLHGRRIQEYTGPAIQDGCAGLKFQSHGRVMIDPAMLMKMVPNNKMLSSLAKTRKQGGTDEPLWAGAGRGSDPTQVAKTVKSQAQPGNVVRQHHLSDDAKMMLSPLLYGFSLGDKIWGQFGVSSLRDVVWDDSMIDSLVLDPTSKDFIQTLVPRSPEATGSQSTEAFDDIIKDKGKGLIGLFVGPPGVGKTLTAEVISELSRRPLYIIGSGELGETSKAVLNGLAKTMELAEAWNAVLLLDEADVFMTERDNVNLVRNAITSVFLRQVEYFQGTMLLTTNRLSSFDPAFRSRIHFCVHYEDLTQSSRYDVWKIFLGRVPQSVEPKDVGHEQITELSAWQLNGRQIKNAMSVAQRYAVSKGVKMDYAGIVKAIEFSQSGWGGIEKSLARC